MKRNFYKKHVLFLGPKNMLAQTSAGGNFLSFYFFRECSFRYNSHRLSGL